MSLPAGKIWVKIRSGSDIRLVPMERREMSYYTLVQTIERTYNTTINFDSCYLKYMDDDGEWITLTNDSDLQCALLLLGRKLNLKLSRKGSSERGEVNEAALLHLREMFKDVLKTPRNLSPPPRCMSKKPFLAPELTMEDNQQQQQQQQSDQNYKQELDFLQQSSKNEENTRPSSVQSELFSGYSKAEKPSPSSSAGYESQQQQPTSSFQPNSFGASASFSPVNRQQSSKEDFMFRPSSGFQPQQLTQMQPPQVPTTQQQQQQQQQQQHQQTTPNPWQVLTPNTWSPPPQYIPPSSSQSNVAPQQPGPFQPSPSNTAFRPGITPIVPSFQRPQPSTVLGSTGPQIPPIQQQIGRPQGVFHGFMAQSQQKPSHQQ